MARVSRRLASVYARRSPRRIVKRNARKHKVIMESVTQEKKKLRSVISFEADAPAGYTFIPAGNPHLTTACKELCRKDGWKVFAVTTTPHMHTHNLSQHVHRIGYHFPSTVVSVVCMDLGLYLTTGGKAVPVHDFGNPSSRTHANSEATQITINTEARDVLKDLFPNIPDNDLNQIIKTAFQKGQRKVGTAVELPLARRAQLAVVAHIRHIYTDYDRLLKTTSFHEARSSVEQPTLAKLVEWRGDDENGKTVLEDVFREVIVISDDEDSDAEGELQPPNGRDYSVEVVSSNPRVEELQTQTVNYAQPTIPVDVSEDEAPPGFRYVPEVPKKNKIDRRGFSRYQAWDRAINQYRKVTNGTEHQPPPYTVRQPFQDSSRHDREPALRRVMELRHLPAATYTNSNSRPIQTNLTRVPLHPVVEHRVSSEPSGMTELYREYQVGPPRMLTLNEQYKLHHETELTHKRRDPVPPTHLVPLERGPGPEQGRHLFPQSDSTNAPIFVSGPRDNREHNGDPSGFPQRPPAPQHNRSMVLQDRVLPSIESPLPTDIRRPNSGHIEHLTKRMSGAFSIRSVTPHRPSQQTVAHQGIEESSPDHTPKRRRMDYYESLPLETHRSGTAPTASDSHPRDRYTAVGQPPVQDPHSRRRYVAPVDPFNVADRQPRSPQNPSIFATHFNPEYHAVHQGSTRDHEGRVVSHGHPEPRPRRRSPEQPRVILDTRSTFPIGSDFDRAIPATQPLDLREPRIYHNLPGHNIGDGESPKLIGCHSEPSWQVRNHDHVLLPHKAPESGRLYADDFVRTIDLRDSPVTEYTQTSRLPTSHVVETPPQLANFQYHNNNNQHRHDLSGSISSSLPRARVRLDTDARHASFDYQVIGERDPKYLGGRLFKSPSTAYLHEKRPEDSLAPSRNPHGSHQRVPYSEQQQRSSPYLRGTGDSRYSYSEGRTVMIAD